MKKFVGSIIMAVVCLCLLAGCGGAQTSEATAAAQTPEKAQDPAKYESFSKSMCKPLDYEAVKENLYASAQDWVYFDATVIEVSEAEMDGKSYVAAVASVDDSPGNWIYFLAEKQGSGIKPNDRFVVYGQLQGVYVYKGMGIEQPIPKVFVSYYDKAAEAEPAGEPRAEQPDAPQAEQPAQ